MLSVLVVFVAFLEVTFAVVTCGPDAPARWTISDPSMNCVISAGSRVAGAVDSVIFNGKEYINACDHGRELQLAVTTVHGECYNPTEAGSENDSGGSATTSRLLGVNTANDTLRTTIAPAFWMVPGQCESSCGCAVNTGKLSNYIMDKAIFFRPFGVPNSFQYLADVHVPEAVPRLQLESPTGYLNGEFNKFFTINPTSGVATQVPSPGEGKGWGTTVPVCLSTQDDQHVMCAISALGANQYVLFDFSRLSPYEESTTKWSIVRIWGSLPAGTLLSTNSYICLGTLADVQSCIPKVARFLNYPEYPSLLVPELVPVNATDYHLPRSLRKRYTQ